MSKLVLFGKITSLCIVRNVISDNYVNHRWPGREEISYLLEVVKRSAFYTLSTISKGGQPTSSSSCLIADI